MIQKFLLALIDKKKIIGWISAIIIAIVALVLNMDSASLKDSICAAPTIDLPTPEALKAPEPTPAPAVEVQK